MDFLANYGAAEPADTSAIATSTDSCQNDTGSADNITSHTPFVVGIHTDLLAANMSEFLRNELLIAMFGPKRDPLYVVIPITCIYVIIFVTGIVGNISTCIVIARNRSMHTATNYYLFSLAVSDFLLLVAGVPQEMYLIWYKYPYVFGELFCVLRGCMAEASANATVLTITAFTVERYVAICHPFLTHTMSKLNRAVRIIAGSWVVSIAWAVPQAMQFGVITVYGLDYCDVTQSIVSHSFEISTFVFFVGPMLLITVLYVLIGLKLRAASQMQRESGATLQRRSPPNITLRQQTNRGTRRVLKMLVAVVVAFFLCWAPFHAQRLVAIYGKMNEHLQVYVVMTYVSGILYYLSTCINPLLYNLMSNKFRKAFKETLSSCCCTAARADDPKRPYRVLSRGQRPGIGRLESTDYSGITVPEDITADAAAHGVRPPADAAGAVSTTSKATSTAHIETPLPIDKTALADPVGPSAGLTSAAHCEPGVVCSGHGRVEFNGNGDSSLSPADSHGSHRDAGLEQSSDSQTYTILTSASWISTILRRLQFWHIAGFRRKPKIEHHNKRLKMLSGRQQGILDFEESLLESLDLTAAGAVVRHTTDSKQLPDDSVRVLIANSAADAMADSQADANSGPIDELSAYMHELRLREQS